MKKKIISFFAFIYTATQLFAQETEDKLEMADILRSSGKIYVVVAVLAIIFIGITIYLISIDRKLSKLENELKKNRQ